VFGTALVLSLRCRYRRAVATILRLLGFVVSLEQQRNRAARGIVDGLLGVIGRSDANDLGHDARDFRRGVKLDLALAGLGGEVAHQVFVGIAEEVIAIRRVAGYGFSIVSNL